MEWDRGNQEIRATDPCFKRSVPQCNQLRKVPNAGFRHRGDWTGVAFRSRRVGGVGVVSAVSAGPPPSRGGRLTP